MQARARGMRSEQTPTERQAWARLRLRQMLGVRFLRQYVVGGCILDFYAPSIRLAVELDGGQHYAPDHAESDAARTEWLATRGIRVLRYTNLDVGRRLADVLDDISRVVARLQAHPPDAAHRPPSYGMG
jgi:very-short-patch-repair endonuclease